MRRLLLTLGLLTLVGLAAVWVGRRPGSATFVWQGYEVQAPIALFFLGFVLVLFITVQVVLGLRWLMAWPQRHQRNKRNRLQKDTTDAVAVGLMALSDGRADEAARAAVKARRALPEAGLSLMLSAQAARLNGDYAEEESYYRRMLDAPAYAQEKQTGIMGLRGLLRLATEQGNMNDIRTHALRALDLESKTDWAMEAMFQLEARNRAWGKARHWLRQISRNGFVEKPEYNRRMAVLLVAESEVLGQSKRPEDRQKAIKHMAQAVKLAPDFVPGYRLAASLLAGAGAGQKRNFATRIEKAWKRRPHPELVAAYQMLYPGRSAVQKLKAVQKLVAPCRQHPESLLALAQAAVTAKRWSLARVMLENELPGQQDPARLDRRYHRLMADLESGENLDEAAARQWLDKALSAPHEPTWFGPSGQRGSWQAVCPQTGAFDAYEWLENVPVDSSGTEATAVAVAGARS
ncbi:MAG: heme biosynthesis protein HemY [Parvibaculales bacterium]